MSESRIAVFYATPLCKKCKKEIANIQRVSLRENTGLQVERSFWKRIRYGIQLMKIPVIVINGRAFSVLGAFKEDSLIAELRNKDK